MPLTCGLWGINVNYRTIICGLQAYGYIKARYPRRPIEVSAWCDLHHVYWFGNKGRIRRMDVRDNKVWVLQKDDGRNSSPLMRVRKILSNCKWQKE